MSNAAAYAPKHSNLFTPTDNGATLNIDIDGYIGAWYNDTDTESFKLKLASYPDVTQINLYITSLGGDPLPAIAIGNALALHSAKVTAYIAGNTASAATIIPAIGATEIIMLENTLILIHEVSMFMWNGQTADEMMQSALELDKLSEQLANIYANRSKGKRTVKQMRETMKANMWLTPTEALALGLIDRIASPEASKKSPSTAVALNNSLYDEADYKYYNLPPVTISTPKKSIMGKMNDAIAAMIAAFALNNDQPPPMLDDTLRLQNDALPPAGDTPPADNADDSNDDGVEALVNAIIAKMDAKQKVTTKQRQNPNTNTNVKPLNMPNPAQQGLELRHNGSNDNRVTALFMNAKGSMEKRPVPDGRGLNDVEQLVANRMGLLSNCGCTNALGVNNSFDFASFQEEIGVCLRQIGTYMTPMYKDRVPAGVTTVMGALPNVEYLNSVAEVDADISPWVCEFSPQGSLVFKPHSNTPRAINLDACFCPGDMWLRYYNFLMQNSFTPFSFPLAQWFIGLLIEKVLSRILKPAMYFAEYGGTSPTTALNVFDGIHAQLNALITAGNPAFNYTMPTLTALNSYDELLKYAKFLQGIWWNSENSLVDPTTAGNIYVSPTVYDFFITQMVALQQTVGCCDTAAKFGVPSGGVWEPVKIPNTNFWLVPHWNMELSTIPESTQRVFATTTANFLLFAGDNMQETNVVQCVKEVKLSIAAVSGAGFGIIDPRIFSVTQVIVPL